MSEQEFMVQLSSEQVTALVQIMALAAEADGDVSAAERAELATNIEAVTQKKITAERAQALLSEALTNPQGPAREARLTAIKQALPPAQRPHALLLAIKVTCADAILRTSERELILELAEALDVPGDTAADLVRAVAR